MNIPDIGSLNLNDISSMAKSLEQADEISKRKNGVEAKLVVIGKSRSVVLGSGENEASKTVNSTSRQAIYLGLVKSNSLSGETLMNARAILLGDPGVDNHELSGKPLTSRTFKQLEFAINFGKRVEGGYDDFINSVEEFSHTVAEDFAKKFTDNIYGTLSEQLKNDFVDAAVQLCREKGNAVMQDVPDFCRMVENRVFTKNASVFDALDKVNAFINKSVADNFIKDMVGGLKLPSSVQQKIEGMYLSMMKESLVRQFQRGSFDPANPEAAQQEALSSLEQFNGYMLDASTALDSIMTEVRNAIPPALSGDVLDALEDKFGNIIQTVLTKAAEEPDFDKTKARVLIHGFQQDEGLIAKFAKQLELFRSAAIKSTLSIQTMLDGIPEHMRPANFSQIGDQVCGNIQNQLLNMVSKDPDALPNADELAESLFKTFSNEYSSVFENPKIIYDLKQSADKILDVVEFGDKEPKKTLGDLVSRSPNLREKLLTVVLNCYDEQFAEFGKNLIDPAAAKDRAVSTLRATCEPLVSAVEKILADKEAMVSGLAPESKLRTKISDFYDDLLAQQLNASDAKGLSLTFNQKKFKSLDELRNAFNSLVNSEFCSKILRETSLAPLTGADLPAELRKRSPKDDSGIHAGLNVIDTAETLIGKYERERRVGMVASLMAGYGADVDLISKSMEKEKSKLSEKLQRNLSNTQRIYHGIKESSLGPNCESVINTLSNLKHDSNSARLIALECRLLGTLKFEDLVFVNQNGGVPGVKDQTAFNAVLQDFRSALGRFLVAPIDPGSSIEITYLNYNDAYHSTVDKLLTDDVTESDSIKTSRNNIKPLLLALQSAIAPLKEKGAAGLTEDDVQSIITATQNLTRCLNQETDAASQEAYKRVRYGDPDSAKKLVGKDPQHLQERKWMLMDKFGRPGVMNFSSIANRLMTLGLTIEDAMAMSPELLDQWELARTMYHPAVGASDPAFRDMLARFKDGSLPLMDLTKGQIGLLKCLLYIGNRTEGNKIRGFNTVDASVVYRAMVKNGLLSDRLDGMSKDGFDALGEVLSRLFSLNNSQTDGVAVLGELLLGTDVITFAEQVAAKNGPATELMNRLMSGKIRNPFDGLAGTEKHLLDFFKTSTSAAEFFTEARKAGINVSPTELLDALRSLEKRSVKAKTGEVVSSDFQFGDKQVRLAVKDGSFRIVFKIGALERPLGCPFDVGTFADRLEKEVVSNVPVFGAVTVSDVLKKSLGAGRVVPTKGAYVKTRDLALTVLETLTRTPVAKFSHLSSERVCKLADSILGMHAAGKDVTALSGEVANALSVNNAKLNSAEVVELCSEVEDVGTGVVDKAVVLPPEMQAPFKSKDPEREFAAEIFQSLQSWKDDLQGMDLGQHLVSLLSERADVVSKLSRSTADLEKYFSFGVGAYRDTSLGKAFELVIVSLRVACGKKIAGAPLSESEIRTALNSKKFKDDLGTLLDKLSDAQKSCAGSLQNLFSKQFAAKLASSKPSDESIEMQTLRQLAGADTFDVSSGYGKFLKETFEKYFTALKGADRNAFLASVLRQTGPDADQKSVMTAMVKAAGPVFQKLIQGVPENALPEELRSIVACSKSSLAPIPPEVVKAKLYNLVKRSNGRIQSIEVKKSLGAASVGEAFLCVIRTKDNPYGEECVVKMLRPDVQTRSQREYEILSAIAGSVDETGSMKTAFDSRFDGILEELDFMQEAKNISLGRIYRPGAVANGPKSFTSMSTYSLVSPTSDMLILAKAEGTTYDRFVRSANEKIDAIGNHFLTKTTDPLTGKVTSISYTKGTGTEVIKAKQELIAVYDDLLKRQKALVDFSRRWTEEAIFNSGIFHGDLHGGNVMTSKDLLTVIDFGNVSKLTKEQRDSLMGIIAACAVNSPASVVDYYKNLLSPAGLRRLETKQGEKDFKQFTKNVESILAKGGMTDAPLRLSAVIRQLDKFGFEVPAPLFNFSQSLTRLEDTIVSVNVTLQRIKAMYADIQYDPSLYDADGINKENPFDCSASLIKYMNHVAPLVRDEKIRLDNTGQTFLKEIKRVKKENKPDEANNQDAHDRLEPVEEENKPDEANNPGGKPPPPPPPLMTKMLGYLNNQKDFDKMIAMMDEVQYPVDVTTGTRTESVMTNTVFASDINKFLNTPGHFNSKEAKVELANYLTEMFLSNYALTNPRIVYEVNEKVFQDPENYGETLKDLVIDHKGDISGRGTKTLIIAAGLFGAGSGLATSERIEEDLANMDAAADKWIMSKKRITHMDAERIKVAVRELLTFSDSDFVYNGKLWFKNHWSNSDVKRASLLKKIHSNLKWLDTRLPQLGFPADESEYQKSVRDFAVYYMGQRNGIGLSFGTRSENSYENMTEDLYNQLLTEAENGVTAGDLDPRVVDVLKSWRADATSEPAA